MVQFLSAKQVASVLNVSVQAVHRLAERSTLAYVRIGGRRFFKLEVVNAYMANPDLQARRRAPSSVRRGQLVLEVQDVAGDAFKLRGEFKGQAE